MNQEIKQKWIAALRSGTYRQTSGVLHERHEGHDKYCCLGVLRDCAGMPWKPLNDVMNTPPIQAGGYLPSDELHQLGLSKEQMGELAAMNDGRGDWHGRPQSFLQIADHIDQQL